MFRMCNQRVGGANVAVLVLALAGGGQFVVTGRVVPLAEFERDYEEIVNTDDAAALVLDETQRNTSETAMSIQAAHGRIDLLAQAVTDLQLELGHPETATASALLDDAAAREPEPTPPRGPETANEDMVITRHEPTSEPPAQDENTSK